MTDVGERLQVRGLIPPDRNQFTSLKREKRTLIFTNYHDQKRNTKKKEFDLMQFEEVKLTLENYENISVVIRQEEKGQNRVVLCFLLRVFFAPPNSGYRQWRIHV